MKTAASLDFMILQNIISLGAIFITLLVLCYYGDGVTFKLAAVTDAVWFLSWHQYPTPMQKYLILVIRRAQIPFVFPRLQDVSMLIGGIYQGKRTFESYATLAYDWLFVFRWSIWLGSYLWSSEKLHEAANWCSSSAGECTHRKWEYFLLR